MCFGRKKEQARIEQIKLEKERKVARFKEIVNKHDDDYKYDYLYRETKLDCELREIFWELFWNDKSFFGGDIDTTFTTGRGGFTLINILVEFGFNKVNPFVVIISNFNRTRPSSNIKIPTEYLDKMYNFIRANAESSEDQFKLINRLAGKFLDYQVFMLSNYEFNEFLKNL